MAPCVLLSIYLTWFGIGSNADKLFCADKYPANSNMHVMSLYFFMDLISVSDASINIWISISPNKWIVKHKVPSYTDL